MPGLFFMKYLAILFGLFILLVIVLADTEHLPRFIKVIYDFPYGDKLGHFILYGLLALFVTLALMGTFSNRTSKHVALTANWQQYHVAWGDLTQAGFGNPATFQGIVMALNWVSLAGPALDFQIDEIALY